MLNGYLLSKAKEIAEYGGNPAWHPDYDAWVLAITPLLDVIFDGYPGTPIAEIYFKGGDMFLRMANSLSEKGYVVFFPESLFEKEDLVSGYTDYQKSLFVQHVPSDPLGHFLSNFSRTFRASASPVLLVIPKNLHPILAEHLYVTLQENGVPFLLRSFPDSHKSNVALADKSNVFFPVSEMVYFSMEEKVSQMEKNITNAMINFYPNKISIISKFIEVKERKALESKLPKYSHAVFYHFIP